MPSELGPQGSLGSRNSSQISSDPAVSRLRPSGSTCACVALVAPKWSNAARSKTTDAIERKAFNTGAGAAASVAVRVSERYGASSTCADVCGAGASGGRLGGPKVAPPTMTAASMRTSTRRTRRNFITASVHRGPATRKHERKSRRVSDVTHRAFRWPHAQAASVIRFTSSVMILNFTNLVSPNVVVIAQSAASRPRAIKMRPMRGVLWRASKVNQRPPR